MQTGYDITVVEPYITVVDYYLPKTYDADYFDQSYPNHIDDKNHYIKTNSYRNNYIYPTQSNDDTVMEWV